MKSRMSTALRAAVVSLALVAASTVAGVAATTTPAAAVDETKGTPGYCPDADGVTVIVDFQELGGTTIIRCAPGDQETGHSALKNAGIEITGTNRWGEAFICRIEGKPGPDSEPCIDTPPASAYWSYWHSPNNGDWTYSQWGVMNRKPPPGSFEGWSFSKDKTEDTNPPPGIDPVRPAGGDGGDGGEGGTGDSDSGTGQPGSSDNGESATDAATDPSADPSASGSEPVPGPEDTPTEAAGWTGGDDAESDMDAAAATSDGGIPTSTLVGMGAIALLAASAGVVAWRRRPAAADQS